MAKARFKLPVLLLPPAAIALMILASLLSAPPLAMAQAASNSGGWASPGSYTISYLGRDGPKGTDHYRVTAGWGATFFGIAVDAMPMLPALQAETVLTDGFKATFPTRTPQSLQPGDSFDFYVPAGTLVSVQWRQQGSVREYRSLRSDTLWVHSDPQDPVVYQLVRAEDPTQETVKINSHVNLTPYQLAQTLYGQGDASFHPDFLQVWQTQNALRNEAQSFTVDLSSPHLDDFQNVKGGAQPGGKSAEGLDIYWLRSAKSAQELFRVDDGIGSKTDPASFPSLARVYYYRDGTVRVYEKISNPGFLSSQKPNDTEWTQVFADFGGVNPAPTQWALGQPDQGAAAQELNKMGITVLDFQPQPAFQGNSFTQLLNALFALMQRKHSTTSTTSGFNWRSLLGSLVGLGTKNSGS